MKFLLLRRDSKAVILSVCRQMLLPGQQINLSIIAKVLDMLTKVYQQHLEKEVLILVCFVLYCYSSLVMWGHIKYTTLPP